MEKAKDFITEALPYIVVGSFVAICAIFMLLGTKSENGSITLDGNNATIEESTKKWIESAEEAYNRITLESAPTDTETIRKYADGLDQKGLGGSVMLEQVKARRLPDGDNDYGLGWQCSKYTAYLATGQREYSATHPDYGPENGKNMADWLMRNFGWKQTDSPVEGAIGSGGFDTLYGHTAEFLYWVDENNKIAMVSDANWTPLTVATHSMNVSGWVWVVPGDYVPDPEPAPTPDPTPEPDPEPAPTPLAPDTGIIKGKEQ